MLIRRGELARQLKVSWPTVKYYTEMGLFQPSKRTPHGQFLYDLDKIKSRYERVQSLKLQRFSISEIKERLMLERL